MGDSASPRGGCLKPFGSTWENVPALRALCSAMCFVFILLISTLISSVNFVEMDILTPPPSPLLLQLHHRGCGDIYNFIGDYDHQLSLSLGDREEPCCAVATCAFRCVISPCDYLYNSFSSSHFPDHPHHRRGNVATNCVDFSKILLCRLPVLISYGSAVANPNPTAIYALNRCITRGCHLVSSKRHNIAFLHLHSQSSGLMSASEEIDPSLIGTPQSEKLVKALTARVKGSQTPAPMADIPKEDGSPKPDTSLSGEDIDDHFIPTILRHMGGHLSDAHVKCIAVTLFTIGITDMEETSGNRSASSHRRLPYRR